MSKPPIIRVTITHSEIATIQTRRSIAEHILNRMIDAGINIKNKFWKESDYNSRDTFFCQYVKDSLILYRKFSTGYKPPWQIRKEILKRKFQ